LRRTPAQGSERWRGEGYVLEDGDIAIERALQLALGDLDVRRRRRGGACRRQPRQRRRHKAHDFDLHACPLSTASPRHYSQ